jgi:predicted transcriptional regulator
MAGDTKDEIEKAWARLNAELAKGIADAEAGRVHTSDEVWAEVHRRMREVQARKAKQDM